MNTTLAASVENFITERKVCKSLLSKQSVLQNQSSLDLMQFYNKSGIILCKVEISRHSKFVAQFRNCNSKILKLSNGFGLITIHSVNTFTQTGSLSDTVQLYIA